MPIFRTLGFAVSFVCVSLTGSTAQEAASGRPTIYVGAFQPIDEAAPGRGPLGVMSSSMHSRKVDEDAWALTDALVQALREKNVEAVLLGSNPVPNRGWVLKGVLYSLDKKSHLIALPFHRSNEDPNVQVSVTIADAAKDPTVPFAVIGTDAVLKGQGNAIGWNPYVIGARLVINHVEGKASINALAQQIAGQILASGDQLADHDR